MSKQKSGKAKLTEKALDSSVRLDKWIWAARFVKTRGLARDLVQSGKVHYNQQRTKPSRIVEVGAVVRVPAGYDEKTVVVKKVFENRQGASIAQTMYEETEESLLQREKNSQARKLSAFHSPRPETRPDKKQRRQLIKFKQK